MSISLRKYQKEADIAITTTFKNGEKQALLKMFCGTGKTRVLVKQLTSNKNNLSVIVFPSISLITQFNQDYVLKHNWKELFDKYKILSICSKNEKPDEITNKKINYTTSQESIYKFILENDKKLISITYQSLNNFVEIFNSLNLTIDLLIFDEAHHIIGNEIQKIVFESPEFTNKVKHILYSTATPKNDNGIIMYDSDYPETSKCGVLAYSYTHYQAVEDGICKNFEIAIDFFVGDDDNYQNTYQAIARSIFESGNHRILVFHSYSEKAIGDRSTVVDFVNKNNIETFRKEYMKVLETEFPEKKRKYYGKKLIISGITGKTKSNEKYKILKDFDDVDTDCIYILSSCRTIGEGVDTKYANQIVFKDPKQSYADIIQNIGRACRKPIAESLPATILLPVWVNRDKYLAVKDDPEERDKVMREDMSSGGILV
jgi:superfamily II DNA or RNA helicase